METYRSIPPNNQHLDLLTSSALPSCLNLELGFGLTGLEKMESMVGLPDFSGPYSEDDYISNQGTHFQQHFASQIVLRRLLVEFHQVLSQSRSLFFPRCTISTYYPFTLIPF